MAGIHGTTLRIPFAPDQRGTLAATDDPVEIAAQSIVSVIETRQGERVMMPDYGLPDHLFAVKGAAFTRTAGFFIRQQVLRYVPEVEDLEAKAVDAEGEHEAVLQITFRVRGSNVPHNLVYPTRRLQEL